MADVLDNDVVKDELYKNEIPYRIVRDMVKMYWPNRYNEELVKYGLVLVKPEALITGKTKEIFSILQAEGYELIYYVRKNIGAVQTSEMWKFSWSNSSMEHILINQKLFSMCDSLILILRSKCLRGKSTCEMLTKLKGPAFESKREPYQIRWKIKPINYVLNYVHTSDDSSDFLREIGILLDWDELIQAFEAMVSNHIKSYPSIEGKTILPSQGYTLIKWLNKIYYKTEILNIPAPDKIYIRENIQTLKNSTCQKITLNFLCVLRKYNLIQWDFETIVIVSSNIN